MTPTAPRLLLPLLLLLVARAATEEGLSTDAVEDELLVAPQPSPVPAEEDVSSEVSVRLHQDAILECAPPPGIPHWRHRAAGGSGAGWRGIVGDGGHRYATLDSGQLRISSVRLEDVGDWRCERHDPHTRHPLPGHTRLHRLAVTEPPHAVFLEVDGRRLDPGNVFLPVLEGSPLSMGCVAEGGVPPPQLSWRLALAGQQQQQQQQQQPAGGGAPAAVPLLTTRPSGSPGAQSVTPNMVRSEARLERLMRAHHNASVACLVRHPALPQPALQVSLLLDVQYSPSFAISRIPGFGYPLREGIPVSLKCDVDSNPPSNPVWVKDDGAPPVAQSNDGFLNFSAIRREHIGWYKCTSKDASSIGYYLNVVYEEEPSVELGGGGGDDERGAGGEAMSDEGGGVGGGGGGVHQQVEAALGSAVTLQCPGGACWRRHGDPVGTGPQLSLERVLYQEAGVYRCEPDRRAQGLLDQRRQQLSVILNVTGAPLVHPANATVAARSGEPVTLRFEMCANPAPDRAVWLVASASALLRPGNATDRLIAHNLTAGSSPLCQEAALTLVSASPSDAGEYSLVVRSPRGLAEGSVELSVMRASGLARAQNRRAPTAAAIAGAMLALLLGRLVAV